MSEEFEYSIENISNTFNSYDGFKGFEDKVHLLPEDSLIRKMVVSKMFLRTLHSESLKNNHCETILGTETWVPIEDSNVYFSLSKFEDERYFQDVKNYDWLIKRIEWAVEILSWKFFTIKNGKKIDDYEKTFEIIGRTKIIILDHGSDFTEKLIDLITEYIFRFKNVYIKAKYDFYKHIDICVEKCGNYDSYKQVDEHFLKLYCCKKDFLCGSYQPDTLDYTIGNIRDLYASSFQLIRNMLCKIKSCEISSINPKDEKRYTLITVKKEEEDCLDFNSLMSALQFFSDNLPGYEKEEYQDDKNGCLYINGKIRHLMRVLNETKEINDERILVETDSSVSLFGKFFKLIKQKNYQLKCEEVLAPAIRKEYKDKNNPSDEFQFYRLTDAICQLYHGPGNRLLTQEVYKGTIASQYIDLVEKCFEAGLLKEEQKYFWGKSFHYEILEEVLDRYNPLLKPNEEDLIIHIRAGDVIDQNSHTVVDFLTKEHCFYYEMEMNENNDTCIEDVKKRKSLEIAWLNAFNFTKPLYFYKNKGFYGENKLWCEGGTISNWSERHPKGKIILITGGCYNVKWAKSKKYIYTIKKFLERHYGHEVIIRFGEHPDDDFAYMCKFGAERKNKDWRHTQFIRTGGGYSLVVWKYMMYKSHNLRKTIKNKKLYIDNEEIDLEKPDHDSNKEPNTTKSKNKHRLINVASEWYFSKMKDRNLFEKVVKEYYSE
jgi:hypothetical protein